MDCAAKGRATVQHSIRMVWFERASGYRLISRRLTSPEQVKISTIRTGLYLHQAKHRMEQVVMRERSPALLPQAPCVERCAAREAIRQPQQHGDMRLLARGHGIGQTMQIEPILTQ